MLRIKQITDHLSSSPAGEQVQTIPKSVNSLQSSSALSSAPVTSNRKALEKESNQETMDRVWKAFKAILACRRSFNTFITDSLRIVDASSTEGKAVFEFTVLPDHSNAYGTIHGGIIASLVDICSAGAVIALADTPFGASIDMSTTYISAAKEGETVRIESICHKAGRTLAFTSTELYVGNKLISKGTHTKLNTAPH